MSWINYLLQVNLYFVLFYSFYYVLLKNETFFQYNRVYLLASAVLSLLIPVFYFEWVQELLITKEVQQGWVYGYELMQIGFTVMRAEDSGWGPGDVVVIVYLLGLLFFGGRFIYSLLRVKKILRSSTSNHAFSFFNFIRIDPELPDNNKIIEHEKAHVLQLHSVDILFFELLKVFNWFNPVCYLYQKAIRHVHEFIADEKVIIKGADKQEYAVLLFSKGFGIQPHQLTNTFFNKSLLKRRIQMLHKQKSKRAAVLKYGLSLPLFLIAMVFSSAVIDKSETIELITKKIEPGNSLSKWMSDNSNDHTADRLVNHADRGIHKTGEKHTKIAGQAIKANGDPKEISGNTPLDFIDHHKNTDSAETKSYMTNEVVVVGYQNDTSSETIFNNVDVLPQYPGGIQAFYEFLGKALIYPTEARAKGIEGRVTVNFIVEKDGALTGFKVLRGVNKELDEEALRVLKLSPKWKPGLKDEKTVRVSYSVPIMFSLKSRDNPPPHIIADGNVITMEEMKKIKPAEIEKIEVLKNKDAIAPYGEKGKNGVVLITLKKKP